MANKQLITSWSNSKYGTWEKCPAAYKYARIDKIPQPPSPHADRGVFIHSKGEQFLKGNIRGVPPEFKKFSDELRAMKKYKAIPEQKWAFSKGWKPCDWENHSIIWLRGITDAHLYDEEERELVIVDFKTGRHYPSHKGQGELYSVMGLAMYPDLLSCTIEFWYLDSGDFLTWTYDLAHVKRLKTKWTRRASLMLAEKKFAPTPSENSCKWCSFKASKGGPCKKEWKE